MTAPDSQSTGDSSQKMHMQSAQPQDFHSLKGNFTE